MAVLLFAMVFIAVNLYDFCERGFSKCFKNTEKNAVFQIDLQSENYMNSQYTIANN